MTISSVPGRTGNKRGRHHFLERCQPPAGSSMCQQRAELGRTGVTRRGRRWPDNPALYLPVAYASWYSSWRRTQSWARIALVAAERSAVEEAVVAHHELQPARGRWSRPGRRFRPRARRCSSPAPRKDMPPGSVPHSCASSTATPGHRRPGTRASPPPGARSPGRSCSRCRRRKPTGRSIPSAACTPGACPGAPARYR